MDVTLSELFDQYEKFKKVKKVTKAKARAAFSHLKACLGDVIAGQVSPAMVNRWTTWLSTTAVNIHTGEVGLAGHTIKTTVGAAAQVFGWALRQKDVDGKCEYGLKINPFEQAEKVKVDRRIVRTYSEEHARYLLQAASKMRWADPTKTLAWYGAILLGLDAGWRRGEIENGRWDDFDLDTGRVRVQARSNIRGECWEWMAKGKAEREEPMSDMLWATLIRLKEVRPWRYPFMSNARYRYLLDGMPQEGRDPIWPLPEVVRDSPVNNWTRDFQQILHLANKMLKADSLEVIGAAEFHMLRKTYGTHLADSGVPVHDAQAMLGHQSVQTTLELYVAVNQRKCEPAVRAAINARKY